METLDKLTNHDLLKALNWRYATKKFDPNRKLSDAQVDTVREVLRLSASSMGLQPYVFIHVTDEQVRKRLRTHSFDQSQITDASELFVFTAKENIDNEYVEDFVRGEGELRNRTEEQMKRKIKGTVSNFSKKSKEEIFNWSSRQAYIGIGNLLTAAALLNIDACPMEGIKGEEYDRILQLEPLNLRSLAVVTLGFRSSADTYASQAKFRFPQDRIIKTI